MTAIKNGLLIALALSVCGEVEARAQSLTSATLGPFIGQNGGPPPGPPTAQLSDLIEMVRYTPGSGSPGVGVTLPLSVFAGAGDVQGLSTRVQDLSTRMDKMDLRLSEGIALASAITIVPPNPGDRFSFSMAGADYDSQGAGSISFTYRASEQGLFFAGYARRNTQNLGKVGMAFSFH